MNGGAYILVVIGILAAKCLGFLRDIRFASVFGASELTDIYFQIFSLASLIFTGIGEALSTLIIKKLNKQENSDINTQRAFVAHFITKTALVVALITGVLYIGAYPIVRLLLPGLRDELFATAVKMLYIMLPSCLFIIVAYIMSGVLQNCKVFFVTSIMSLPYNVIIIASLFVPDISITTVSVITTIGWFLHIIMLMPSFIKNGYSLFGSVRTTHKDRDNNREILYIFISSMMFQLIFMIDKASVSADGGAASTVNYASNLFVTISSVFVVAMSRVSYPSICRYYESGSIDNVNKIIRYIITVLLAIFVPFILTVSCFGRDIISMLYQRGEFTKELSDETALLFSVYTFGIFGYVCQELLNKVLYLDSKYRYTVTGTIIIVVLKPLLNMLIVPKGGAVGAAICTTVMFILYAVCILYAISRVIGNYFKPDLRQNIFKILLSGGGALAAYEITKILKIGGPGLGFVIPLGICGVVYVVLLLATGCIKYIVDGRNH